MSAAFILYSDFNCPFCYAFQERLALMGAAARVEWRGVQHAPRLPLPMVTAGPAFARELEREVAAVRRLAPEIPIALPQGKPNTGPAIQAVATACFQDARRAEALATSFYRAFWRDGKDISDAQVISALTTTAGFPALTPTTEAKRTAGQWYAAWLEEGRGSVPDLIRRDGEALTGLVAPDVLERFLFAW
ncbi:DsbA family oxidoreductase [Candidatus Nitrospira bockiana]